MVEMNSEADLPGPYRPRCTLQRRSAPLAGSHASLAPGVAGGAAVIRGRLDQA
jgi:hypothetical protein